MTIIHNASHSNGVPMDTGSSLHEELSSFIAKINDSEIASIRTVASGLIRLLEDPAATMRQFTDIIELDPPLTGKILARSNSVSCYSNRTIDDIEQAVLWIGLNNLKELALHQKVCEVFIGGKELHGYSRLKLWKHSVAVAFFAKTLFRREFGDPGGLAYSTGLLHDIGLIAIDQLLPGQFNAILTAVHENGGDITCIEQEILGFDHGLVGQALALDWELSRDMAACIGLHADPFRPDVPENKNAAAIYLADQLCREQGFGYNEDHHADAQTMEACQNLLGTSTEALELILSETVEHMETMEEHGLV